MGTSKFLEHWSNDDISHDWIDLWWREGVGLPWSRGFPGTWGSGAERGIQSALDGAVGGGDAVRHRNGAARTPAGVRIGLFDQNRLWRRDLVRSDKRAEQTLGAAVVALDRSARLQIEALDVTDSTPSDNLQFPDWLNPGWIEAIVEDGERLGTAVVIPERPPAIALASGGGLPGYKLRRVMEFIEANIDQPLPLEDLAAAAAVSPFHFHRQFKQSTGVTPHRYILQVRMQHAKALLSGSDLPLAEVAAQVGFADQSHFTSTFKKATSMTPRSYRNATASA
jgi:AraC-like DNA-binding protein